MNIDNNSNNYLNFYSPISKETNRKQNYFLNDIGYKKIVLYRPNKKLKEKFSFNLSQINNINNNEHSIMPLKKLILQEQNNLFSDFESKYNYIKSNNNSNYIEDNIAKLDFISKRQIPINNNIIFNKGNDYFSKNSINSLKFFNNKSLSFY